MNKDETYYTILGVEPNVDQSAIRKAYLKLSLKWHPDKNPENQEEAKQQFVKIGEAYEVLSDPAQRAAYDRDLASGFTFGGSPQHSTSGTNNSSSYEYGNAHTGQTYTRPTKSYESYREAFDDHVAHMSEDELRAAMGTAAVIGSILGSIVGSRLAHKVAGNNAVAKTVIQTAGSLLGSTVGSEAGAGLVLNVHQQSRDRISYEERKRVAMERGEPLPEPPKKGWADLRESLSKTVKNVQSGMEGTTQPRTARGQLFQSAVGALGAAARNAKKMQENKK
ncbi:DnaJ homolog subfamily B member 9 [Chaetoceros tenuissimus]|uniref:DnaJ homolog subfamily B member 9 n=1 Tax=Chaetoceros tenuissimus TaxID=426638 RepID=A0AAD3H1W2_9STRA|nr:DnaJ homolog subfamily B member 9 [Chaetoceros tenuissimus]